ncbi:MAG: shikimate kinase [Mycobacteriales bacterium]
MTAQQLVLVGPPGAGKTTVGRILAERLGVGFRDTDADVEASTGRTIPEIFYDDGEERFRALERDAVRVALAEHDGVLCLGGGAVLSAETRELLKGRRVVLLLVGLADGAKRVGLSRDRPVLALNPRAALHKLLEDRMPLYREVATQTVETDGKTPEQVADEVLA